MDLGGQLELAGDDLCQWLVMVWILGLGIHENDELVEAKKITSLQRLLKRLLILYILCGCWKG
jgi:hypothetical protein